LYILSIVLPGGGISTFVKGDKWICFANPSRNTSTGFILPRLDLFFKYDILGIDPAPFLRCASGAKALS